MFRIPLEFDDAAVARLGDQAAAGGALTTGGRVVGRNTGNGFVRRHDIRNELADVLRYESYRRRGAGGAKHLEELAAFDCRRRTTDDGRRGNSGIRGV